MELDSVHRYGHREIQFTASGLLGGPWLFVSNMRTYTEPPLRVANPHTGEMHDFNWWGDNELTERKQTWTYCGTQGGRGTIFIACNGLFHMVDVQTGDMLWEQDGASYCHDISAITCLAVSYIVVGRRFRMSWADDRGFLIAIDKETGKEVWKSKCPAGKVFFETGAMKRMIAKGCQS